jgi:hypothetical protein
MPLILIKDGGNFVYVHINKVTICLRRRCNARFKKNRGTGRWLGCGIFTCWALITSHMQNRSKKRALHSAFFLLLLIFLLLLFLLQFFLRLLLLPSLWCRICCCLVVISVAAVIAPLVTCKVGAGTHSVRLIVSVKASSLLRKIATSIWSSPFKWR